MKTKIIKGTNLVFFKILQSLNKITKVTGKLGYAISKAKKDISNELSPFEEQRQILMKKYGETKEDGTISIIPDTDNFYNFFEQLKPVGEIVIEVTFSQITEEEFEKTESLFNDNQITVQEFDLLQQLFIWREEDKEEDKK